MTDWNNPTLSQTWSNRDSAIKGRDESNAKMNYASDSNIPDGTIRWNATTTRFEKWSTSSSSWNELSTTYAISVTRLNNQQAAYYDDIPNGTRVIFYQSSAPTGYTQVTSVNDRVIRVVSGSGGGSGGSWTISGVTVDGHTLTVSEMPAHVHTGSTGNDTHNHTGTTADDTHTHFSARNNTSNTTVTSAQQIAGTGDVSGFPYKLAGITSGSFVGITSSDTHAHSFTTGNDTHSHSITLNNAGGDASHTHGLTSDGTWRPSHIDVIIAERQK